jgi:hypothetical protein
LFQSIYRTFMCLGYQSLASVQPHSVLLGPNSYQHVRAQPQSRDVTVQDTLSLSHNKQCVCVGLLAILSKDSAQV